jgi:hypothetical protein
MAHRAPRVHDPRDTYAHCQVDDPTLAIDSIADWFADKL